MRCRKEAARRHISIHAVCIAFIFPISRCSLVWLQLKCSFGNPYLMKVILACCPILGNILWKITFAVCHNYLITEIILPIGILACPINGRHTNTNFIGVPHAVDSLSLGCLIKSHIVYSDEGRRIVGWHSETGDLLGEQGTPKTDPHNRRQLPDQ